jgi:aspartyl-tRNA(Asn)/glutamyl-tRNA(Gln) amidotransferase subunit A
MVERDLTGLTIAGIASKIKARRISPVVLTDVFLERIKKWNSSLNAYQTLCESMAREQACQLDKELRAGKYRGPLHGVPFSIKDNLATAGVRTTAGSKMLAEWVPEFDATVVDRLKSAGAVIVGKTNMHEWASGSTTINPYYGATLNPWDRTRIPGGSSGGSAAAVAASLCLGSIGTDNAGSVRNPAALCGVVGLKATYGRVSRFGGVPGTGGFSTDHFGVFARTVRDCALVLRAIAGFDPKDPLSSEEVVPDYINIRGLSKDLREMKVGLIPSYFDDLMVPEVAAVFRDAIAQLKALGMKIRELSIPHMNLIPAVQTATSRVENVSTQHHYLRTRPRDYSPALLYRHINASLIPAETYVVAQRVRRLICREFDQALEKVDVIAAPTVAMPAPTIEECKEGVALVGGKRVKLQEASGSTGTQCTIPFNVTGLPAISVCCGFSSSGLPIGMQIAGPAFQERTIFQVAHAYEKTAGWYLRRPPLI